MNVKELIFNKDGSFVVRHRPMTITEIAMAEKTQETEVNANGI